LARAYAEARGDQQVTTALYIKMRASELQEEAKSRDEAKSREKSLAAYLQRIELYNAFLADFKRQNPLWFFTLPMFREKHYALWLRKHGYTIEQE
jgi:hypothetical protein